MLGCLHSRQLSVDNINFINIQVYINFFHFKSYAIFASRSMSF